MKPKIEIKPLTATEVAADLHTLIELHDKYNAAATDERPMAQGYTAQIIGALQTATRFTALLAELPAQEAKPAEATPATP